VGGGVTGQRWWRVVEGGGGWWRVVGDVERAVKGGGRWWTVAVVSEHFRYEPPV